MEDIVNIIGNSVQIIFEYEYNSVIFKDALYFTSDEYNSLSQIEIDTLKQERYQSWIDTITNVE
jgi:hypothetical protein